MRALTAFVMDTALRQCATWHAEGREVAVSVNISPTDLADPGFPDLVGAALARHGLPGGALVLELTENGIVRDPVLAQDAIRRLHDAGVAVSIDDFGAGVTSLAYLRSLSVHSQTLPHSAEFAESIPSMPPSALSIM